MVLGGHHLINLTQTVRVEPLIPFEMHCGATVFSLDYCLGESIDNEIVVQDMVFTETYDAVTKKLKPLARRKTFVISTEELLLSRHSSFYIEGIGIEPLLVTAQRFLDHVVNDYYSDITSSP